MGIKIAIGNGQELCRPDCVKAVLAEVILTFLFVFAGVGSAMATDKLAFEGSSLLGLTVVALTHAFVVYAMVSAGFNISGGHINPAVTLGLAVGGHITIFKSVLYWIAQCLGSAIACYLLVFLTGGMVTPVHALASGVTYFQGVIWEIVLTFSLLFTVYATAVDPKKGSVGPTAPLCIGLVVFANIIAGGPFSGASMNPARSFGPALASGDWREHWVFWVGPLIGGGLAGFVYEGIFLTDNYSRVPDLEG
ncbi:hypothetical protein SUGI_1016380 [Cryptomeria japonica]|uniref:aquaporin TIP4-1 n=1 Tax=Cryptomeria japonica TaxID=3369 RepID=UPI002414985A|nr:aquaporin TIP4-1 [Cryptomeria japonica]GLJ48135.1 hypothetical protein SUGI_1016380 [Cryptomeria japonica]